MFKTSKIRQTMLNLAVYKDLLDYLKDLIGNTNARFKDLIAESFDFVQFSFKTDIGTTNCGPIALEMAELQADNEASII